MLLWMKIGIILTASCYLHAVTRFEIVFELSLIVGFTDSFYNDLSQLLFPRHSAVNHYLSFRCGAAVLSALTKVRLGITVFFAQTIYFVLHRSVILRAELQLLSRARIYSVYDYVTVDGFGICMRG